MADTTVRGRFVWHELMTSDASSAHSFYTKVLGWKTQAWEHDASYTMFAAASGPLAGSWQSPAGAPHWLPYIGTPDIAATVEQARILGARVSKEITELSGNGGRYAVLDDPQGAAFGVYSSSGAPEAERDPNPGEYSWHELLTTDFRAAFDFYSTLFGWEQIEAVDMGPIGTYFMFGRNGTAVGGMFNRTEDMPGRPAWLGYVRVKNLQQTVDKAKAAGGAVVIEPMEVPGGDWIAQFADPQGALFAVHTLAVDLKKAEETSVEPRETAQVAGGEKKSAAGAAPRKRSAAAKKKPAGKATTSKKAAPAKKSAKKGAKKATKKAVKKAAKKGARKAAGKRRKTVSKRPAVKAKRAKTSARGGRRAVKSGRKAASKRSVAKRRVVRRPRKAK